VLPINFNDMGLYRNIAGIDDRYSSMGLVVLQPPGTVPLTTTTPSLSLPYTNPITDPNYEAEKAAAAQAYIDMINSRYDWLMQHTYDEVTAAGYYVYPTDGSIFLWTDPGHTTSSAWLPLQDIQNIENARGTAGALLMHLQEPVIAKDTAGFSSGSSSSFQQSGGVTNPTPDTQPIPEVADLPPVVTTPTGTVQFDPNAVQTSIPLPPASTTPTTTTTPTTPTNLIGGNALPVALVAGTAAVALYGERILGSKRKLAFLGLVAALGYITIKKQ